MSFEPLTKEKMYTIWDNATNNTRVASVIEVVDVLCALEGLKKDLKDFMRICDAEYKMAVDFEDTEVNRIRKLEQKATLGFVHDVLIDKWFPIISLSQPSSSSERKVMSDAREEGLNSLADAGELSGDRKNSCVPDVKHAPRKRSRK